MYCPLSNIAHNIKFMNRKQRSKINFYKKDSPIIRKFEGFKEISPFAQISEMWKSFYKYTVVEAALEALIIKEIEEKN